MRSCTSQSDNKLQWRITLIFINFTSSHNVVWCVSSGIVATRLANNGSWINVVCLLGRDLCVFSYQILPLVEVDAIGALLVQGRRSKTTKTKTLATWATKVGCWISSVILILWLKCKVLKTRVSTVLTNKENWYQNLKSISRSVDYNLLNWAIYVPSSC